MNDRHLGQLLEAAALREPARPAVEDEHGRRLSYAALLHAADRLATRLASWGIGRDDRVGVWLHKSLEAVTAIHGILRAGASYVPVDATGPAVRAARILATSATKAIIVAADIVPELHAAWPAEIPLPRLIVVAANSAIAAGRPFDENSAPALNAACEFSWHEIMSDVTPSPCHPPGTSDDLAYILFTSGSTGQPKGVMLSHANAFTFLDWCQETLGPWEAGDRFASHAPFHFDLSVFDLFVACRNAATVVLIGETLARDALRLGDFLAEKHVTVWYSAPSILALLAQHGRLERPGYLPPRLVLFAGEVFPITTLTRLRAIWPDATLWNLYGPTETNVCTAFRIPDRIAADQTDAYPIGSVCRPLRARVVDEDGRDVPSSALGELVIAGPGVMRGYFGQPELTAAAFFVDDDQTRWYRTGDLVQDTGGGCYQFHGRRDRMVKKRGYRIELGEIESALYRHGGVNRAAVVARNDGGGLAIAAFIALKPEHKRSIIAMKRHCTNYLPHYMIPDTITFLDDLPATSTDKVDYQRLRSLAAEQGTHA